MNFQHLRDNLPFGLACLWCGLVFIFLLFFLATPLWPPFRGTVIFPFLSIYHVMTVPLVYFSLIFFLFALVWASFGTRIRNARRRMKRALTLFLAMVAIACLFLPTVNRFYFNIEYLDKLAFKDRLYQLVILKITGEYCKDRYFTVYQCDSSGFVCSMTFKSQSFGNCVVSDVEADAAQASLFVDDSQKWVFVEVNGERFVVNS